MFATFKRFALVVLVPAVVGLGVWAQWSTLTTKFAMLGTSSAESMPAEIATDGVRPDARAADPEIKPAPAPDRRPENGAAEQALPQAEKFNVEPALANPAAQAGPAAAAPKVKRLPFAVEPRPQDGAVTRVQAPAQAMRIDAQPAQASPAPPPAPQAKPEVVRPEVVKPEVKPAPAAEQRSVQKATSATKEPEAAKPQAQEKPTPKSEAKSEVKPVVKSEAKSEAKSEIKADDRAARKENAAKREKTEQATQSRNNRSASRERPSRSSDPDDSDPRRTLTELRRSRSMADFYDRLEALGLGMR
jgi:hypothetical protein